MYIKGSIYSKEGRIISIELKRCVGEKYCKTEEEIKTFLKGKWLLLINNQKLFNPTKFEEESIESYAKMTWIPINTQF